MTASRPDRLIDQGAPVLTLLEQVLSLLKLLPLQLAAKDGSAMHVHAVGEVLTGDANLLSFPTG